MKNYDIEAVRGGSCYSLSITLPVSYNSCTSQSLILVHYIYAQMFIPKHSTTELTPKQVFQSSSDYPKEEVREYYQSPEENHFRYDTVINY